MYSSRECMKWVDALSKFVFENENDFMKRCWKHEAFNHERVELMGFYISTEQCQVTLLFDDGVIANDTVNTSDVLAWYDQHPDKITKASDGVIHHEKTDRPMGFPSDDLNPQKEGRIRKPADPKDAKPRDVRDPALLAYVIERLEKLKPATRKKALSSITTIFQYKEGIRDKDRDDLFDQLIKRQYLSISQDGCILYKNT